MKRILTISAFLILLCFFTACYSSSPDPASLTLDPTISPADTSVTPTTILKQETNTPEMDLISTDLQNSLKNWREENGHYAIAFRDYEIIKSQTLDRTYSAQIDVTAHSKYAEHHFIAEVAYTLYDQGWFLDSCQWEGGEILVINYPTQDELIQFPDGDILLDATNLEWTNDGFMITVTFTNSFEWGHYATGEQSTTTQWTYDPSSDQWLLFSQQQNDISSSLTSELFDIILVLNKAYFIYEIRNLDDTGFEIQITDDYYVKTDWIRVDLASTYIGSSGSYMCITFANNSIDFYEKNRNDTFPGKLEIRIELRHDTRTYINNNEYNILFDYTIYNLGAYGFDAYANGAYGIFNPN